jgi:hypothetical protein
MKKLLFVALAMISLQAFGQRYEFGKASKTLRIKPTSSSFEVNLNIPLYKIEDKLVLETVTCRIPECSTELGDGSEGHWHGYFSVRASEKAKALAAAIKGIGKVTAERIVDFNLFTHKPNNWREFSVLIKKIERQLEARGYSYKFSTQVLEVHGYDNLISLGYGTEKSCRYVETFCDQLSVKEVKTFSHYIERNLSVSVKNQTLQSFETDTLEITAGSAPSDVSFSATGFNRYTATLYNRGRELDLDAVRIKRAFPVTEVSATLTKDVAKNFIWNLNVPQKFFAEDKEASMEVIYELCRSDWFGGCFAVVGGPFQSTLSGNKIVKTFTTSGLKKGSKYFVRARLNKVDSKYYSNAKSDFVNTGSIKN